MKRVVNIKWPSRRHPKSTLAVDADVARLIRKVVVHEGELMSTVLHKMLLAYVAQKYPTAEIEVVDDMLGPDKVPVVEKLAKGRPPREPTT